MTVCHQLVLVGIQLYNSKYVQLQLYRGEIIQLARHIYIYIAIALYSYIYYYYMQYNYKDLQVTVSDERLLYLRPLQLNSQFPISHPLPFLEPHDFIHYFIIHSLHQKASQEGEPVLYASVQHVKNDNVKSVDVVLDFSEHKLNAHK